MHNGDLAAHSYTLLVSCQLGSSFFQAFTSVLEPPLTHQSPKGSPKKKQKTNEQLHARFIQAVSELQFLGFIKSTRQKTDHVQRLTWGAC